MIEVDKFELMHREFAVNEVIKYDNKYFLVVENNFKNECYFGKGDKTNCLFCQIKCFVNNKYIIFKELDE